MCGIVGLFIKDSGLEPELGTLLGHMLVTMTERGPDSAGFAIYGEEKPGHVKFTVRGTGPHASVELARLLDNTIGVPAEVTWRDSHAVVSIPKEAERDLNAALGTNTTGLEVVGQGRRMEIFKETGLPEKVADRFGLAGMRGTHGIGHTRMATESAVTTQGAHPFSTGADQCLVHNGSLSNHNAVRRELIRKGLTFKTDNDSEVAAGYLTSRLAEGAGLNEALQSTLDVLDGFFTFVVGTETGFGVLRDRVACKPAVMAETPEWVAFGTEYRALAQLPGIEGAKVWEPEPATVYFWERS